MEPMHHEYKDHHIELRELPAEPSAARAGAAELELLIDNELVPYGRLPGGKYFLHDYAYDWQEDLIELTHRFIDYRDRSDEVRRHAESRERG
jgi:hypothetical protein